MESRDVLCEKLSNGDKNKFILFQNLYKIIKFQENKAFEKIYSNSNCSLPKNRITYSSSSTKYSLSSNKLIAATPKLKLKRKINNSLTKANDDKYKLKPINLSFNIYQNYSFNKAKSTFPSIPNSPFNILTTQNHQLNQSINSIKTSTTVLKKDKVKLQKPPIYSSLKSLKK